MNKKKYRYAHVLLILGVCMVIFVSCASNKSQGQSTITSLKLYTIFPMGAFSDKMAYDTSMISLYRNDKSLLYKIPVRRNHSILQKNNKGDVIGDTLISLPNGARYFFYYIGDTTGILYDTSSASPVSTVPVASFLKDRSVANLETGLNGMIDKSKLIETVAIRDGVTWVDKYITELEAPDRYDTLVLTYSKEKDVNFSFSEREDRARKAKINKVQIKFNGIPTSTVADLRIPRQIAFEFQNTSADEQKELSSWITKMDSLRLKNLSIPK
jgi:hypothetical protein